MQEVGRQLSSRIFVEEKKEKWTIHYILFAHSEFSCFRRLCKIICYVFSSNKYNRIRENSGYVCGFKIDCWICNPLLNTNLCQVQTAILFLDNHWWFWPYWYYPEKVSFDNFFLQYHVKLWISKQLRQLCFCKKLANTWSNKRLQGDSNMYVGTFFLMMQLKLRCLHFTGQLQQPKSF